MDKQNLCHSLLTVQDFYNKDSTKIPWGNFIVAAPVWLEYIANRLNIRLNLLTISVKLVKTENRGWKTDRLCHMMSIHAALGCFYGLSKPIRGRMRKVTFSSATAPANSL